MQIEKECEPYLKSTEVIQIIQSGNETFKSRIFNCINKHKSLICSNIITTHTIIERELLKMCSENAFQDTQMIFLQHVKANKFSPDYETCIPYLKGIFRKKYWYEYQRELKRKIAINTPESLSEDDIGEEIKERREKVRATVLALSDEDRKMYKLRYEEGLKPNEIASILPLKPQSIRDKLCKLHRRFEDIWKY